MKLSLISVFLPLKKYRFLLLAYGPLFIVLCCVIAIYHPGLNGPLILDDVPNLKQMLLVVDGEVSWLEYMKQSGFSLSDRPVSILSFLANFSIVGTEVWYLKVVNLFIHLCCGVLIYFICLALYSTPALKVDQKAWKWMALWVVSAWLLAPIQVSTTLYVVQRMAQLSTLFILAGLLSYVLGRQCVNRKPRLGYVLIILSFIIFLPLALFSKENGAILPVLIFVIELFFFYKNNNNSKADKIIINSLQGILFLSFCTFILLMIYMPDRFLRAYSFRDFTLYERLLTQPRILIDYLLNMLMIPGGSGMGLFHDDFQKSTGLLVPVSTIFSIIFWCLIIMKAIFKLGAKAGFVLFGLFFYLAAHMIESSFIPLELYFEHRNYLPSFGIFFALALAAYYLATESKIKNFIISAMILIIIGYSFFTMYRVDIWQSWSSILLASEELHPNSLRVQKGLVVVYTNRGDLVKTLEHLSKVEKIAKDYEETAIALKYLMAYCYAGQYPPDELYQRIDNREHIPFDHYTGTVFLWFVESIENGSCEKIDVDRLLNIFHNRISYNNEKINYNNWVQVVLLARLNATQGNWLQAQYLINKAIELKPEARKKYVEGLKRYYDSM